MARKLQGVEKPVTEKEVRWGLSMLMSRAYHVQISGRKTQALIPGIDTTNHASFDEFNVLAPKCEHVNCRMMVLRPMKSGEQMMAYYGELSNVELLARYGFTLPNNFVGPHLPMLKPNKGEIEKSVWLIRPEAGLDCGTTAQLEGAHLVRTANENVAFVPDDAMRCSFLAEAFHFDEDAHLGLNESGKDLPARCLKAKSPDECAGGFNKSESVEYIEAAGRAHYAAKEACYQISLRVQNKKAALQTLFSLGDAVSEQLGMSIGAEIKMINGCMKYHGDRFRELVDMARVKEFGE